MNIKPTVDELEQAFDDLVDNAPLDFWETGSKKSADAEEEKWNKQVTRIKVLITRLKQIHKDGN